MDAPPPLTEGESGLFKKGLIFFVLNPTLSPPNRRPPHSYIFFPRFN